MGRLPSESVKAAARVAAVAARSLLKTSEDVSPFGVVAKLINELINVCDQYTHNKGASLALQERFCRLANHLFDGPNGLAAIANKRPDNQSLAVFSGEMETILNNGIHELSKFANIGFFMSFTTGSKPQELFESLDRDMTQCLKELSVALQVAQLNEQAQTYDVVCNIRDMIDQRGGLEGVNADPTQLQALATEIGADVSDLKSEISNALFQLDKNVRGVGEEVIRLREFIEEKWKNSEAVHTPTTPSSSVKLESLSCYQLCALFDHYSVSELKTFVTQKNLNGTYLKTFVDSESYLLQMGMAPVEAKLLFYLINEWKKNGLPEDFTPPATPAPAPTPPPPPPAPPVVASTAAGHTAYSDNSFMPCRYLDRHRVGRVGPNQILTRFQLQCDAAQNHLLRYNFETATLAVNGVTMTVREEERVTPADDGADLDCCYLDRQLVRGPPGTVLTGFQLKSDTRNIWYEYTYAYLYANNVKYTYEVHDVRRAETGWDHGAWCREVRWLDRQNVAVPEGALLIGFKLNRNDTNMNYEYWYVRAAALKEESLP